MNRNDQYSAAFTWDSDYGYMVEILRNGKPFFEEFDGPKERFRFGVEKAKAILHAMPTVKTFADSRGIASAGATFPIVEVMGEQVVAWHDSFKAHGRLIPKPYLQIRRAGNH